MWQILFGVVSWMLREVVLKFVILAVFYAALVVLAPIVVNLAGDFVSPTGLTAAWSALPAGLWFFLDWLRVSYGVPLVIAAMLARFSIRRVPLIG